MCSRGMPRVHNSWHLPAASTRSPLFGGVLIVGYIPLDPFVLFLNTNVWLDPSETVMTAFAYPDALLESEKNLTDNYHNAIVAL